MSIIKMNCTFIMSTLLLLLIFSIIGSKDFLSLTEDQKKCINLKEKYPFLNCNLVDKIGEELNNLQLKEKVLSIEKDNKVKIKSFHQLDITIVETETMTNEDFMRRMNIQ